MPRNCPERPPGICIECGRPSVTLICHRCDARPDRPIRLPVSYLRNGEPVYRCPSGGVR